MRNSSRIIADVKEILEIATVFKVPEQFTRPID